MSGRDEENRTHSPWHPQVLLPGGQNLLSTAQVIQPQSPIIQLVRQPSGALTQVVGNPGLQQILGLSALSQQQIATQELLQYINALNGLNLNGLTTTSGLGLGGLNGLGIAGLPYGNPGLTTASINGLPLLLSGLNNGLLQQGISLPSTTSSLPLIQSINGVPSPLVSLGPVVRQVPEADETSSVVELDPMDAALLDKEKKGQMHMEKYAWGRNLGLQVAAPVNKQQDAPKELRADIPRFYSALPTGYINTGLGDILNQNGYVLPTVTNPTRSVNPFLGLGGKRKKHFEHYEYF
ncbi:unnamed protein product [Orchesella dallaii]|uniref:Uncharacterized protein n=1 Tax=Orchesella dallaii TaxID=48710 RepID=A0ABP1S225_9HEXA